MSTAAGFFLFQAVLAEFIALYFVIFGDRVGAGGAGAIAFGIVAAGCFVGAAILGHGAARSPRA